MSHSETWAPKFIALVARLQYLYQVALCLQAGRSTALGANQTPVSRWTAVGFEPSTFSICMLKVWCSNQLSHLLLKVSNTVGIGYDVPQMILLIKVSCLLVFFPKRAGISKNCLHIEKKKDFLGEALTP